MYRVDLTRDEAFEEFRDAARGLIGAGIAPADVVWRVGADLLAGAPPPHGTVSFSVPAAYMSLAETVACHNDPERFALLYEALWRITHGERELLSIASDPLVHRLERMEKAVRRDMHKMTAFLRFRQTADEEGDRYVAWFEPEHHILRRMAEFFVGRFAAMRWSILTPQGAMHWDGKELTFSAGVSKNDAPAEDALEDWWRTYYRATFNPARANLAAMQAEMPKKYWRNMPETALIPGLLAEAGDRTRRMVESAPTAPRRAKGIAMPKHEGDDAGFRSLTAARKAAESCTRCPLYKNATQTVFGEGPAHAQVVFVGEQPGDQEDLQGRPFVGPAGQMFDRALAEAGIDRSRVYVTNAVKHFKFEPRGKRRIHQKPNNQEIEACRWWLDNELHLLKPRLTVALGATAARALTGRDTTISRARGRLMPLRDGVEGFITVHPSFLLRLPDEAAKAREYARFVKDLRLVAQHLPEIRKAA
ncbi:MAG: uracil-DNA glycosylase [Hyphomicrobiales bacterium]|nr:uracil-DNA glycosylase [Hyphomicrobiales bacterium]